MSRGKRRFGGDMPPMTAKQRAFMADLCQKHYRGFLKYAMTLVPPDEAEDLVQAVFLLAAERIDELTRSPSPDGWLAKALMFKAKNLRARSSTRRKRETEEPEKLAVPSPESDIEDVETAMTLEKTLTPDEYRLCRLVYYDGYTMKEAAERMGVSSAACRKRMERIRHKLRAAFSDG